MKQALSISIVVMIAVLANAYLPLGHAGWVLISAFIVCQTTKGTPLRQALLYAFLIILAMLSATYCMLVITHPSIRATLLASVFILSSTFAYYHRPQAPKQYFVIMLFPLIFLIAMLSPQAGLDDLPVQFFAIFTGVLLGIGCGKLIAPFKIEEEFRLGMVPILRALIAYSSKLTTVFLQHDYDYKLLAHKKIKVEKALVLQHGMYPEWVYETGFNPGLRASLRFFLIHIEQVTDLLFSMHYYARQKIDTILLQDIAARVEYVMQKNEELLGILITYFAQDTLMDIQTDFTSDINELNRALMHILPKNAELIDLSPDYITLAAFTQDMRDLRGLLLQLVMSLPVSGARVLH